MNHTTDTSTHPDLQNPEVREYYNKHLKQLDDEYIQSRWFSSKVAQFDYEQTRLAITHALRRQDKADVLEVGPGDGVWTDLILPIHKKLTLLDQSDEMIARAQKRLSQHEDIKYRRSDISDFETTEQYGLIFAIRCFEYFEHKPEDLQRMYDMLREGGTLVVVTKNANYISRSKKKLHTRQVTRAEMHALLDGAGFERVEDFAATLRLKSAHAVSRVLFGAIHRLHVATSGRFSVPYLFDKATESYIFVAQKPSHGAA
jgi:trans-aconitate methyltransferase